MIAAQMVACLDNAARIEALRRMPRVDGGGPIETINGIDGLIELIRYVKPTSVLEIGSHLGVSTEVFLAHGIPVTAVDPWPVDSVYDICMERCSRYPGFKAIREFSPEALAQFADREFDMVYIDGDHHYRCVVNDIKASRRLARRWLAGHDYCLADVATAVICQVGRHPDEVFSDSSWVFRLA